MKWLTIALFLVFSGCGNSPAEIAPITTGTDDSQCATVDVCTNADVPGYACKALRHDVAYQGYACVIAKEDFQTSPSCDPSNPSQVCQGGGWGAPSVSYPCCESIQGPGQPAAF